jgi:hypothetical protein
MMAMKSTSAIHPTAVVCLSLGILAGRMLLCDHRHIDTDTNDIKADVSEGFKEPVRRIVTERAPEVQPVVRSEFGQHTRLSFHQLPANMKDNHHSWYRNKVAVHTSMVDNTSLAVIGILILLGALMLFTDLDEMSEEEMQSASPLAGHVEVFLKTCGVPGFGILHYAASIVAILMFTIFESSIYAAVDDLKAVLYAVDHTWCIQAVELVMYALGALSIVVVAGMCIRCDHDDMVEDISSDYQQLNTHRT